MRSLTRKFALLLLLLGTAVPLAQADLIKIGMLSTDGFEKDMRKWQPTADYLGQQIPGHVFQILPYKSSAALHRDAAREKFDFIFTNPASYIYLQEKLGATRLLTVNLLHDKQAYSQSGAVIFTRADQTQIQHLADLKERSFIATSATMFAGWQQANFELTKHGLQSTDFSSLSFSQSNPEAVIHAVLTGKADAGAIPAGIIEKLAKNGQLDTQQLKVLNAQQSKTFPFVYSTSLSPQWALAQFEFTKAGLAQKVMVALLSMPANHQSLKAANYAGWVSPGNYQTVKTLMQTLQLAPFEFSLQQQLWHVTLNWFDYLYWILGGVSLFLLIVLLPVQLVRIQRAATSMAKDKLHPA